MTGVLDWTQGRSGFPSVLFKRAFQSVTRAPEPGAQIVTAYTDGQVTLRSNRSKVGYHEAADTTTYKGVRRGDFVVHGLDILRGSVGVSDSDGVISPVCTVCVPKEGVHGPFVAYTMRAQARAGLPRALARGVREGGADFRRWDTLGELPILLPAIDEQRRIADFLNDQLALLDCARALRQEQVDLLEEHFTSSLHDTLEEATGSGGFADVPLKYLCRIVDTEHKTAPEEVGGGHFVAGTGAIRAGTLLRARLYETDKATYDEWTQRAIPRRGDLVLTREAPVGEVALLTADDENVCIGQRVVLLRPNARLSPRLLLAVLLSPTTRRFYADVTQGSLHPHLNMRDIGSIRIPVAPLAEQEALADRLIGRLRRLDEALVPLRTSLDLLAERRGALITAAVTGEFDVTTARRAA